MVGLTSNARGDMTRRSIMTAEPTGAAFRQASMLDRAGQGCADAVPVDLTLSQ